MKFGDSFPLLRDFFNFHFSISLIYILLSLIVMVVQGILDMADWWVLGSNFVLAAAIVGVVAWTLNAHGLFNFAHTDVIPRVIALLAGVMNLSAICLADDLPLGRIDLLVVGFAVVLLLGVTCWQSSSLPVHALSLGLVVSLLTPLYLPSLFWLGIVLLVLLHCACLSLHNAACVVTGLLTGVWVIYCLMAWWADGALADNFLLSFLFGWDDELHYSWPVIMADGLTPWLFLVLVVGLTLGSAVVGLFLGSYNSLRMRSNVMLHTNLGILLLVLMPTCWPMYLTLATISIIFQIFLAMSDEFSRQARRLTTVIAVVVLLLGVGEPLLLMAIDFLRGVTWPWESWEWPW